MKFCWATLMVNDITKSLEFYREIVKLEIDKKFQVDSGVEIAFLGNGETKIELICNKAIKETDLGKDISLGFEVESVDSMLSFVKAKGYSIHSGPFQPNPHTKFFYILDPNGLKIQFVENIV